MSKRIWLFAGIAFLATTSIAFAQKPDGLLDTPPPYRSVPEDKDIIAVDLTREQRALDPRHVAELQDVMQLVGCPDWRSTQLQWTTNSAQQFRRFLEVTGQLTEYQSLRQPSLGDLKQKLFHRW